MPRCCDAKSFKKSQYAESLSPRRAQKARPNVYAEPPGQLGSELPHEMSYPTDETLQYGVTLAQESGLEVHMFRHPTFVIDLSTAPESHGLDIRDKSGAAQH
jgi:hypothetical protein